MQIDSCANLTGVSSPLGLNLHKNQTFLDLIHTKLREEKTTPHNEPTVSTNIEKQKTRNDNYNTRPTSTKWKASNFPATKLKIGCWEVMLYFDSIDQVRSKYSRKKLAMSFYFLTSNIFLTMFHNFRESQEMKVI